MSKQTESASNLGVQPQNGGWTVGRKGGELRESMPRVAEFVDECRAAFGQSSVNRQIRAGLGDAPTFYARENGMEIGTKVEGGVCVSV